MLPSYKPLTAEELRAIARIQERAITFAQALDPEPETGLPSLESLDRAFVNYLNGNEEGFHSDEAVEILGVALGSKLVEEQGFMWVTVTDDYGKELGILARPGRGDVTIFPVDFVSKRYELREAPFLMDAVKEIERHLLEIAAELGDFG